MGIGSRRDVMAAADLVRTMPGAGPSACEEAANALERDVTGAARAAAVEALIL